jgi:hypothetical protein
MSLTFGANLGIMLKNHLINPKHLGFHREKQVNPAEKVLG